MKQLTLDIFRIEQSFMIELNAANILRNKYVILRQNNVLA